ncbi:hypothetical protein F5148DRAFT_51988 [Russula earlei]|uniref:Uncharacterized protein n=1 Tax=Russula earlei TaxID=71964 RepID=A0ACC0UMU9_9AGAM|nr:hypothetical protein F5148DRAFT_51988 [Russula earlei]
MNRYSWAIVVVIFASLYMAFASYLPSEQKSPTATEHEYAKAHSLGSGYSFDPKDGWQTVNVSNLSYKHSPRSLDIRGIPKVTTPQPPLIDRLKGMVEKLWKGIQFWVKKENPVKVAITWYTGKDLLNPSCWKNPVWAPTDHSFVCAVTQEGWTSKPKCFDFLELCISSKKCIYIRVVDSCAGCAKGSQHVDLTKAAFNELADLDQGLLTGIYMREAGEPSKWSEDLWGPKHRD